MRKGIVGLALCLIVVALPGAEAPYYPPPGQWTHKAPAEVGMDAARLNDAVEFMKASLEFGAQINAVDDKGNTALHGAAQRGSIAVIDFLIDHGASLDARNGQGRTPLDEALAYFPPREQAAQRLRDVMTRRGIPVLPPKPAGPRCCGGCDCSKDLKPAESK